jgi:hypothetical protein
MAYANAMGTTAATYTKAFAECYWGREIEISPPELGGAALGERFTTDFGLKKYLLMIEEKPIYDQEVLGRSVRILKEFSDKPLKFRPWKKIPQGKTRTHMKLLGSFHGIHSELIALKHKAANRFLVDKEWYYKEFWVPLERKLDEAADYPIGGFWDWAVERVWPNAAIPQHFISSETDKYERRVLPFVRLQKERNKYTLPAMMEAYINKYKLNITSDCPTSEIDFNSILEVEVPIYEYKDTYKIIYSVDTMERMVEFSTPRRVQLDHWYRNQTLITGLKTPRLRSKAALEFMTKVWGYLPFDRATWYTEVPIPYKESWEPLFQEFPPGVHQQVLMDLHRHGAYESFDPMFTAEDIQGYIDTHKAHWKSRMKSKAKSRAKTKAVAPEQPGNFQEATEILSLINMDDINEMLSTIWAEKFQPVIVPEPEPPVSEASCFDSVMSLDFDLTPFDTHTPENVEEDEWNPEADDEDDLIQAALDELNYNPFEDTNDWG